MSLYTYEYEIVTEPTELAVSLALLKEHLKLDASDTSQDLYLELLIKTATLIAEKLTRRTFINTEFKTYRDSFFSKIELRRSKLQSITSFEYLLNDVYAPIDSNLYSVSDSKNYSVITLKEGQNYPDDSDDSYEVVRIIFVAGFGPDNTYIPNDLKLALLDHITYLYENRGDCDNVITNDNIVLNAIPNTSKMIYMLYKIPDLIGQLESQYRNG